MIWSKSASRLEQPSLRSTSHQYRLVSYQKTTNSNLWFKEPQTYLDDQIGIIDLVLSSKVVFNVKVDTNLLKWCQILSSLLNTNSYNVKQHKTNETYSDYSAIQPPISEINQP